MNIYHRIKSILLHVAIFSLVFDQCFFVFSSTSAVAQTLPITSDGTTNVEVTKTASGVDQVNIATPNASGLSHNKFNDYNINTSGQIINNFSNASNTATTSTQIGGLVISNPNLRSSGSARLILNEVTSTNNSQLRGYAEIAGTKAELIIANPNGITCAGCGFINTSRLSLIAGKSSFDNSGNLNFDLSNPEVQTQFINGSSKDVIVPLITVEGLGLDVERASAADIIAASFKLTATIYGSSNTDVSIKTGDGNYNYSTKEVTSNNNQISSNDELFAIDASNLGAIQSGNIYIIATKDGLGANIDATLFATKEMKIDTKGNLYYADIQAATANIKSSKNITHKENKTLLANKIDITSGQTFSTKSGSLNKSLINSLTITSDNFVNSGSVLSATDLNINTTNILTNAGILNAVNKINLSATDITNEASGIIGSFSITNNDSSSTDFFTKIIEIKSHNLTNKNLIYATETLSSNMLDAEAKITNLGILVSKDISISANQIINKGDVEALQNITLNAVSSNDNGGKIINGENAGSNNYNIKLLAGNSFRATADNGFINYAVISSNQDIAIKVKNYDIDNYGKITGGIGLTKLEAARAIGNYTVSNTSFSKITSNNDIELKTSNLVNESKIESYNNITADISNNLDNNSGGFIFANNELTLEVTNKLTNNRSAVIRSLNNLTIKSQNAGLDNLFKIAELENISATIESLKGEVQINAKKFINRRDAQDLKVVDIVKTDENKTWYEDEEFFGEHGVYGRSGDGWSTSQTLLVFNLENQPYRSNYVYQIDGGGPFEDGITKTIITRRGEDQSNLKATIKSAKKLTINSDNFYNENGDIISLDNIEINSAVFNNAATVAIKDLVRHTCGRGGAFCKIYYNKDFPQFPWNGAWGVYQKTIAENEYHEFEETSSYIPSAIRSRKTITINASTKLGNGTTKENDDTIKGSTDYIPNTAYSSPSLSLLKTNGFLDDIAGIANSISNQSDIVKNSNPNLPRYESRSEFSDISKFFGSEYFFNQLGLDGKSFIKQMENVGRHYQMFGDAFAEQKLIERQIELVGVNRVIDSDQSYDSYIQGLIDNAVDLKNELNLDLGTSLSSDTIKNLTKDIVWFETVKMSDGTTVVAPKLYLSQTTRDKLGSQDLRSGAIIAAEDINILGDGNKTVLNNFGSIIANNNFTISNVKTLNNAGGNSANRGALLAAGNNISATISDDILNRGTIATFGNSGNLAIESLSGNITNDNFSIISAGNNLSVKALNGTLLNKSRILANNDLNIRALDVKNISTVETNDVNLLNANSEAYRMMNGETSARNFGKISSQILETASISGGNVAINATNDFTNLAANISATKNTLAEGSTSTGNLSITAGDDINISTLQLRNRKEERWGNKKKGGERITDITKNIQSILNSEGDINISSLNDISLRSVNINAEKDIKIDAENNLILTVAQDSRLFTESTRNEGIFTFKNNSKGNIDTTVIDNIISSSSGTMNLSAQNVAYLEYKSGNEANLGYLNKISAQTILNNSVNEVHKAWDKTTRGLTETGTLVIAVAGAALTGGLGSFATIGAAMLSAGVGTAATIATTSATNTLIDGGNFNATTKQTLKDTTSKESLQAIAISSLAAGISTGVNNYVNTGSINGNTTPVTNNIPASSNVPTNSGYSFNPSNSLNNLRIGVQKAVIDTGSVVVATSAVKGESLGSVIEKQGGAEKIILDVAVSAIGEAGSKEIGAAYHGDAIGKPTQLTLHGTLGCAVGGVSGNCAAGAAGAIAGEIVAENYFNNKIKENGAVIEGNKVVINPTKSNLTFEQVDKFRNNAVKLAKVSGALAAVPFSGGDFSAMAIGSNTGSNAAENNALYLGGKYEVPGSDYITGKGNDYDVHGGVQGDIVTTSVTIGSDGNNKNFNVVPSVGAGAYLNVVPHGAKSVGSVSGSTIPYTYASVIKTDRGMGFGTTFGIFSSPARVNVSVTPPQK